MNKPRENGYFLRVANLSKVYQEGDQNRIVLMNACAEFAHGEFAAVVGNSGSGKSTLLNLISGIDRADAGDIYINGRDLKLAQ